MHVKISLSIFNNEIAQVFGAHACIYYLVDNMANVYLETPVTRAWAAKTLALFS